MTEAQTLAAISSFDFSKDDLSQLLDKVDALHEPACAITPLLLLMERHPDTDFGSPGKMVHFLERYFRRGYEEQLLESLKRQPTPHTVWMAHRVLSGVLAEERGVYLAELERISRANLGEVSEVAAELLEP